MRLHQKGRALCDAAPDGSPQQVGRRVFLAVESCRRATNAANRRGMGHQKTKPEALLIGGALLTKKMETRIASLWGYQCS